MGYEDKLVREGMPGVMVFVFRPATLERWHVLGEIPFGLDDLVRVACAQGEEPLAVVTLKVDVFEHAGVYRRAVRMLSEAGGQRFERILAMLHEEGDGQMPKNLQYFGSPVTEVERDGWIGVAPISPVTPYWHGQEH